MNWNLASILFGVFVICLAVDKRLRPSARKKLGDTLSVRMRPDLQNWVRVTHQGFLIVFDFFYGGTPSKLNRLMWRAIVCSYGVLLLARAVLAAFSLPVPETERILLVAVLITIGALLMLGALEITLDQSRRVDAHEATFFEAATSRWSILAVALASAGLFMITTISVLIARRLAESTGAPIDGTIVAAIGVGSAFGVPILGAACLIPTSFYVVSAAKSFVLSLFFIAVLACVFPTVTAMAVSAMGTRAAIVTFVLFNLFADAISLVVTRWLLVRVGTVSFRSFLFFLLADFCASVSIFLLLPGIADFSFSILAQGIFLAGPQPWVGLLFWSTFFTSALLYFYVPSVLVIRGVAWFCKFVQWSDKFVVMYKRPGLLLALAASLLIVCGWGVTKLVRLVV